MSFHHVVVLGAGPIGLLTAIEARQNFVKNVTVVEKRTAYTRTNVPVLQTEIYKQFKSLGVLKELGSTGQAPFSQIEEALKEKALSLGVKFELGYVVQSVIGMKKNKYGRFKSIHITVKPWDEQNKMMARYGGYKSLDADLLVVCTGGAAAADPAVTQTLGFTFHKLHAKNYGAYGVFVPHKRDLVTPVEVTDRRKDYKNVNGNAVSSPLGFETPDHNYLLVTLAGCSRTDFKFLQANSSKLRTLLLGVGNSLGTAVLTEIKEVGKNVALFKIAIQRADQFYSEEFPAVIVGDAAVTPHPEAGSGIGTGFKGLEELKILFASLKKSDRSDNNDAAFKTFNDAYEVHVSKKALEGTGIVLANLIKLVTAYCDEVNAAANQIADQKIKALAKTLIEQALQLKKDLEEEKEDCKRFEELVAENAPNNKHKPLVWDPRMERSVGQLWANIGFTYDEVKALTGKIQLLGDRLDKIETMLKFDAQKKAVA